MRFGAALLLSTVVWPFAACDGDATANAEVAAELRALRAALVAMPRSVAREAPPPAAALGEALTPLRDALTALVANQDDLQRRQLALTQELQRWSALLVESTRGAQREETGALAGRLRELEAALAAQDARHREVEQLVQRALDHTADRLEQFLETVEAGTDAAPVDAGSAGGDGAASPAPEQRATNELPPVDGSPPSEGSTGRWDRSGSKLLWWGGVALVATGVGFVCLRRWHRSGVDAPPRWSHPSPHPVGHIEPDFAPSAASPGSAGGDPDVQEIWAAAALLGEAVGRLRDGNGANGDANGPTTAADADDWVVLDDELLASPAPAAAAPRTTPPAEHPRAAPAPTTCRLRTADPQRAVAAVLRVLQHDPRVLRRPEPAVRCGDDTLEVSFRLLPGLSAGEQSHVEQRLRDACSGRGA